MSAVAGRRPPRLVQADLVRRYGLTLAIPLITILLPFQSAIDEYIINPSLFFFCVTEALEAATASLSVDAQKRAAKDAQKKAAKAEAALQKQADKLANSLVTIKRIERNKKKFVTSVSGLEAFGLDLKKVRTPHSHRSALYRKPFPSHDSLFCVLPSTLLLSAS